MKNLPYFCVLFLILSSSVGAVDTPDPIKPDTVYLEYGKITKGTLILKVMIVTDNVGDTNNPTAFTFPFEITSSNPAAKPVIDTTVSATYSGTIVEKWPFRRTLVRSHERNPGIFPLEYWLTVFGFGSSVKAGRYHLANIVLRLQDTTTICVDTFLTPSYSLRFTKASANGYVPQWRSDCFRFRGKGTGPGTTKEKGKGGADLPNSHAPNQDIKRNKISGF